MPPLADLVAVAALVALLVVAYRHPRRWVEALVALGTAALAAASGLLSSAELRAAVTDLLPVVAFLVTILVVGSVCERAGLFRAAAGLLRGGGAVRLFTAAFLLGVVVTTALSLDATVVLLTPVVVAAAAAAGLRGRPGGYACLRMANSASLLLPVANLTNLLALPSLDLSFAGFAVRMAPVLGVVLLVEYVGLRLLFRGDLRAEPAPVEPAPTVSVPLVPAVVVALMLAGFAATSPFGVEPWWVSATAAALLVAWAGRRGLVGPRDVVRAAHPEFALLVLALGVAVAAISQGFLGDRVADLVPSSTGWPGLLLVAVLATVLANALTNLSATLLLVPLVAPLGDTAVLAALIGLNVGSGLTLSGSLANLLWRRTLAAAGTPRPLTEFHRVSLLLTPVSLVAAVSTLWLLA